MISILIEDWNTVADLKKEIKDEKKNKLKDVDADSLQLFLAKKEDGSWLDGAEAVAAPLDDRGNPRGFEQMDPLLWLKDAKYFGENFTQGEGKAHVLVVVPKVKSKRPATAKAQRKKLFNALEWREPMRLCTSDGQDWAYQGAPGLVAELAQPLVAHNEAWKLGYEGKQNYAINLVLDGRGTGKSRMLDEMKGLLCEAAKQSQQQELVERMKNAYVFRVTFEGGTSSTGNLLDSECPEFDVSYRMLYQLAKDRIEWPKFVDQLVESYPSLFLCIEEVMEILATLEKIGNMKNMTVILCVDGLQQLVYDGTKSCAFYRVLATICGFLNSSRAFAVCVYYASRSLPAMSVSSSEESEYAYREPVTWHHQKHDPSDFCKRMMNYYASIGDLGRLRWLYDNCDAKYSAEAVDGAATNGHLEVVKWLHDVLSVDSAAMRNSSGTFLESIGFGDWD
ncbi:hypothetical protein PR003_g28049, partial [Phytophthora rubi]